MFDYIEGRYASRVSENQIVVDVGGMGILLFIVPQVWSLLPPVGAEKKVKIFVSLHVNEKEGFQFYGFDRQVTRDFFNRLKSISGCGPKTALNILARFPVRELSTIIQSGNAEPLKEIRGIGGKIAERLLVELRAALKKIRLDDEPEAASGSIWNRDIETEVKKVLASLGYLEKEISWVFGVLSDKMIKEKWSLDRIIQEALDEFGKRRGKS